MVGALFLQRGENVKNVEVGDRVAPLFMGCGHCKECLMGKSFCCEEKKRAAGRCAMVFMAIAAFGL